MKKLLMLFFVATVAFSSCKKYEDGPSMSLRSTKSRIAGEWDLEKAFFNKKDVTHDLLSTIKSLKLVFKKDGSYEAFSDGEGENGKWEFNSNKDKVIITIDGETEAFNITRLTKKELWFYIIDDSDKIEYQFKRDK